MDTAYLMVSENPLMYTTNTIFLAFSSIIVSFFMNLSTNRLTSEIVFFFCFQSSFHANSVVCGELVRMQCCLSGSSVWFDL